MKIPIIIKTIHTQELSVLLLSKELCSRSLADHYTLMIEVCELEEGGWLHSLTLSGSGGCTRHQNGL